MPYRKNRGIYVKYQELFKPSVIPAVYVIVSLIQPTGHR